jgi:predicted negative regulator of RcsB-dependent stress response
LFLLFFNSFLVCDKINEKYFVAMKCLFEGEIRVALENSEFGEQCFNEALARGEDEAKKAPFGKYILPYANFKLANLYTDEKNYEQAKIYLNKARDNYKDYEMDDRIQTQIRSLQRRIKHYTDGPRLAEAAKARQEAEQEIKKQKLIDQKNFYVS